MKIKVTTVEEVELDVTYPYYSKSAAHHCKVISERAIIVVTKSGTLSIGIELLTYNIDYAFGESCTQCSEDEFNAAFKEVQKLIEDAA